MLYKFHHTVQDCPMHCLLHVAKVYILAVDIYRTAHTADFEDLKKIWDKF